MFNSSDKSLYISILINNYFFFASLTLTSHPYKLNNGSAEKYRLVFDNNQLFVSWKGFQGYLVRICDFLSLLSHHYTLSVLGKIYCPLFTIVGVVATLALRLLTTSHPFIDGGSTRCSDSLPMASQG